MCLVVLFLIGSMLSLQLDLVRASSPVCVLRSPTAMGDVVFQNVTNCSASSLQAATSYNIQKCPKHHTFLGEDCCQSDQIFNDCDLQLTSIDVLSNISSVPVVWLDNVTQLLHIISHDGSSPNVTIHLKGNSTNAIRCHSVQNVSATSSSTESLPWTSNDTAVKISTTGELRSDVYRLDLNCTTLQNVPTESQCLYFKLVNSMEEVLPLDNNYTAHANQTLETCHIDSTNTGSSTRSPTPETEGTGTTTTEELSIWEKYNRLLIYVVIGGGCGVGLLLVFIIMLCILTGCIAKKRRKRARRRHQLETAPSIRRRPVNPENTHSRCNRNLSYSLTTYENDESAAASEPALTEPQPFPQLQLVLVEIPMMPASTPPIDLDDEITFDTFKRSQKKKRPSLQLKPSPPEPAPPETDSKPSPPEATYEEPSLPEATYEEPSLPDTWQKPSQPDTQLAQPETPTIPTLDTADQGYYDSVVPAKKSHDEDSPTEEYDILVRASSQGKSFTISKSNSHYSQLNLNSAKSRADPYDQVIPLAQRSPYSPSPSPIPPPISSMELLNPQNKYAKDILTSSWSKPSLMDRVVSHSTPELLDIYDSPTELFAAPPPAPKPAMKPVKRARGRYIIGEGDSEVIYDIPPVRKVSEDTVSIGSYVDMQSQFYML